MASFELADSIYDILATDSELLSAFESEYSNFVEMRHIHMLVT